MKIEDKKITLFSEGDFDVFQKCGVKLGYF